MSSTTSTRTIREGLARLMDKAGYSRSAFPFGEIGKHKGSRLHGSYASRITDRDYTTRDGGACRLAVITLEVRTLLQRQADGELGSSYDVDDATDDLVDLLESFAGTGFSARVDEAETAQHSGNATLDVVTVTLSVMMHQFRSGDYA